MAEARKVVVPTQGNIISVKLCNQVTKALCDTGGSISAVRANTLNIETVYHIH